MFFSSRKTETPRPAENRIKSGWAVVILKPLRSEVRSALSRTLSELFAMSGEEAANVVENTPNILLDELSQEAAVKLKDSFRHTGAEMFLTEDAVVKSKCFRTVWPERPRLSFLNTPSEPLSAQPAGSNGADSETQASPIRPSRWKSLKSLKEEKALASQPKVPAPQAKAPATPPAKAKPEPAAPAPKAEAEEKPKVSEPVEDRPAAKVTDSSFIFANNNGHQLKQEFDRWKEKYEHWKQSFSALHQDVQLLREEKQSLKQTVKSTNEMIRSREDQIKEQKGLLESVEEKYRLLQEEFFQNRTDFEKRLSGLSSGLDSWKETAGKMLQDMETLSSEKQNLEQAFKEQREKYEILEKEYHRARSQLEEKVTHAGQEVEHWKGQAELTAQRLNELEKTRGEMEQTLAVQQEKYSKLEKEYRESRKLSKIKDGLSAQEFSEWQERERKMVEKLEALEKMQKQVIEDLNVRKERDNRWQEQSGQLDKELKNLSKNQEKIQSLFGKSKKKPAARKKKSAS